MGLRADRRGWMLPEALLFLIVIGLLMALASDVLLQVRMHQRRTMVSGEAGRLASAMLAPAHHDICVNVGDPVPPQGCGDLARILIDNDQANNSALPDDQVDVLYRLAGSPPGPTGNNENPRDYFVLSPEPARTGIDLCEAESATGQSRLALDTRRDVTIEAVVQHGIGKGTEPLERSGSMQTSVDDDDISWFGVPVPSSTPAGVFADQDTGTLDVRIAPLDSSGRRIFGTLQRSFYADSPGPNGCYIAVVPFNAAVTYRDHNNSVQVCVMTQRGAMRRC